MVIVDTGFLCSLLKIGKPKLLLDTLQISYIVIPSTVCDELRACFLFQQVVPLLAFSKEQLSPERFILVENVNLDEIRKHMDEEKLEALGSGKKGCLLLAHKTERRVFIDDRKAAIVGKSEGIKVCTLPTFLAFCRKKNVVNLQEMKKIINDLKVKDFYEFTDRVKAYILQRK